MWVAGGSVWLPGAALSWEQRDFEDLIIHPPDCSCFSTKRPIPLQSGVIKIDVDVSEARDQLAVSV